MAKKKTKKKKVEKKDSESKFKVTVEESSESTEKPKEIIENPAYVETPVPQDEEVKAYDHPHSEHHEASEPEAEETPEEPPKEPKKDSLSFWAIFIAFIVSLTLGGLLVGGIFYFRNNVDTTTPKPTQTPESTLTPSAPEPTSAPTVEISELSVQVLNGSGVAGEAGKVTVLLEPLGFADIDSANAKTYDYTSTEISTKESVPQSIVDEIEEALDIYKVKIGADLDEDYEYDVVVIVGTSKN